MLKRSRQFYTLMNKRRTVRFFSDKPVPLGIIENIVRTAGKLVSLGIKEITVATYVNKNSVVL